MTKDKIKKYAKEIALFFLIMTLFANIVSFYRSSELNKISLDTKTLSLLNDTSYRFEKHKPVLLYFWATWCPSCKMQSSNIESISKKFNVLSIAIKSGDDKQIEEYLKKSNLSFRVHNDTDGEIAKKFNISVFPTTIIYDKKGEIFFSDVGYTTTFGLWLRMWWAGL